MGVEYKQCDRCGHCVYEEYISDVIIEGYATVTLCNDCRKENMNMEEAKSRMEELERKCRQETWEALECKHEDNTKCTPKREWLEGELRSMEGQMEQLQKKKRRLEILLK